MSFVADIATFSTGTGIVGTTIDVPLRLGGLTPKVIWCMTVGRTDATDANGRASIRAGYGFAVSTSSRACIATTSADAVNPSDTSRCARNDAIVATISSAGSVNGLLDINSLGADTVQFIVDQQFASDLKVFVKAFAGTDITNASIASFFAGSGDFSVGHTGIYFEFMSVSGATDVVTSATATSILGRAIPGPVGHILGNIAIDNVATSDTGSYSHDAGEVTATLGSTSSITRRTVFNAPTATGFNTTWFETGGSLKYYALVLNGTFRVSMGTSATSTGASLSAFDSGFVPSASAFWSHCKGESTVDTMQADSERSIGWALGQFGQTQAAMAFGDPDNVAAPTTTSTAVDYNSVYVNLDTAGAIEGEMAIRAPNTPVFSSGISVQMTDADPANNFYTWAAFGPAAASTTGFVADIVTNHTSGVADAGPTLTIGLPNIDNADLTPKVLKFTMSGMTGGGTSIAQLENAAAVAPRSVGWCVSGLSQVAYGVVMDPATLSPNVATGRGRLEGAVLVEVDRSGNVVGSLAVVNILPGGVEIAADGFSRDFAFTIEAWAGDYISSATINSFVKASGTGTQTVNCGNASRYVELLGFDLDSGTDASATALLSYGRCWVPTTTNQVIAWQSQNNVASSNTGSYGYQGEIHALPSPTGASSCTERYAISAADPSGFVLNRIEAAANTRLLHCLSVAGTFEGALGNLTTRTDGNTISTGISLSTATKAVDAWSICAAQSTNDVTTNGGEASIGAVVNPLNGASSRAMFWNDVDAIATGKTICGLSMVDVYLNGDASAAVEGALEADTDVSFHMRDPDPSGLFVMLAAFGDGTAPVGGSAIQDLLMRNGMIPFLR